MWEFLEGQNPIWLAFLATLFTWWMTALGAAIVFFVREANKKLLDSMLGFAAGVMIAASFWSLLAPAIEIAEKGDLPAWFPPTVGFLLGGLTLGIASKLLPHLEAPPSEPATDQRNGGRRRTTLLILAITLHNIPEGLAIGVAFGALASGVPDATLPAAVMLAIGIGIQNMPEAAAVSLPLRGEGYSRFRSFWYGQLSGIVEPMAGVLGALAVVSSTAILPYALGFAAGAMIFVVVEELIPGAQCFGDTDRPTIGAMLGFALMMALDVGLG